MIHCEAKPSGSRFLSLIGLQYQNLIPDDLQGAIWGVLAL
jgi:hypothetical protein